MTEYRHTSFNIQIKDIKKNNVNQYIPSLLSLLDNQLPYYPTKLKFKKFTKNAILFDEHV